MSRRRALSFTPSHTDIAQITDAVRLADELGYELACLPEGWCLDSTALLTWLAGRTERIKLGATILSIWGRTPATLAMAAVTLQALSGGRFVLGLGASTPTLAEGLHDVRFDHPADKLRKVTTAVRALLDGDRAPISTDTTQRPLRLGVKPSPPVPIWHGTVSPLSTRVTAETADGWFPAWASRASLAALAGQLAALRTAADPTAEPLVVVCGPVVNVDDDVHAARAAVGATIAWYLCSMGPLHPRFVASQGYAEEVAAVQRANPHLTPSSGVIPPEATILLDDFTAAGPPEEVRASLSRWDEVADIVTVGMPPPGTPWPTVEATIRAGAP